MAEAEAVEVVVQHLKKQDYLEQPTLVVVAVVLVKQQPEMVMVVQE